MDKYVVVTVDGDIVYSTNSQISKKDLSWIVSENGDAEEVVKLYMYEKIKKVTIQTIIEEEYSRNEK